MADEVCPAHAFETSIFSRYVRFRRFEADTQGQGHVVKLGRNVEVRPLGGAPGCRTMILVSVVASVVLTVLVNLLAR